ncbi:hypothetical protein Acr_25g0000200 [Actinidia rufa]|uniref:Uncharacterized protein n=1 Tax=Actinidia rufa TaxID=165716 RepID=A0A7J0GXW7_9ERIC|nr:hypothetical protein Acr_25g0000200 [Actinidia rufa]
MSNTSASQTLVVYDEDHDNQQIDLCAAHDQLPSSEVITSEVDLELRLGHCNGKLQHSTQ